MYWWQTLALKLKAIAMKDNAQPASLESLLEEGARFKRILTTDVQLSNLERLLRNSMVPMDPSNPDAFVEACTGPGIYHIDVKFPFSTEREFEAWGDLWGRINAPNGPAGISRFYPKRALHHVSKINSGMFIPFYLGKETNVQRRLNGHAKGKKEASTYSLKLNSRPDVIKGIKFRFGFVPIPAPPDAFYCIALLEHALRERLHPIIGRQ